MILGMGDPDINFHAVEDQEAAIASANAPRGGSGTISFGWDFTKIVPPWGSESGPPVTATGSVAAPKSSNTIFYVLAAGAAALVLLSQR